MQNSKNAFHVMTFNIRAFLFLFLFELSQVPAAFTLHLMLSFPCIGVPMAVKINLAIPPMRVIIPEYVG